MRSDLLFFLDETAAEGREVVTNAAVRERLDLSPQAASNLLSRSVRDGFLDRVDNGVYVLRPVGMLGTRAASEEVALAVAAKFGNEPHRIAYRSALDHHGLLTHPARAIQVVLGRRSKSAGLSGRRLQTYMESADIVALGSEPAGRGANVSTVERALLECAHRPAAAGGWAVLAEAIYQGTWDARQLEELAERLDMGVALRRIGSIAERVGPSSAAQEIPAPAGSIREIKLDPRGEVDDEPWFDPHWRVRWPTTPDRARELVES